MSNCFVIIHLSFDLRREMEAIERDIASRRNLGGFKRFFGRTADARVIEACRARLNKALRLFEVNSFFHPKGRTLRFCSCNQT